MFRRIAALVSTSLFIAGAAGAAGHWQTVSFTITPQNLPKVIAATDKFMASDTGKAMPGTLSLMASVIDGADPATHSFISSMDSIADREKWTSSLEGSADWAAFLDTVSRHTDLGATSRMVFEKNWGDAGDADAVWEIHALTVSNPAAYEQALDGLMASETGKDFEGSLWLSTVAAAGLSHITHVVSVGSASETAAAAWNEKMASSDAWATFIEATDGISEFHGTFLLRTLKTWGTPPAS
jgi:hypothetical protein